MESHTKFKASLSLPFSLLADTELTVSRQFDAVLTHEGKDYAARKVVLIDKSGKVTYRDDEYSLGDSADLEALLAAVEKL